MLVLPEKHAVQVTPSQNMAATFFLAPSTGQFPLLYGMKILWETLSRICSAFKFSRRLKTFSPPTFPENVSLPAPEVGFSEWPEEAGAARWLEEDNQLWCPIPVDLPSAQGLPYPLLFQKAHLPSSAGILRRRCFIQACLEDRRSLRTQHCILYFGPLL